MSGPAAALRIEYSDALPIAARRREIEAAIRAHPVVVVCGETGSGKTTQLPKICLEAGCGQSGLIGHTQPRRLAARAVATRLAAELGCRVGHEVGYQVRFNDRTDERTRIKVMTDGILLNEIRADRDLRAYDTLIIDEAHERSINVDFLLGYLKLLLGRRPDLKLVITSATVDPQRFADYFDGAPVVDVAGKTYPIAIEHCPPAEDQDVGDAVVAACHRLTETAADEPGDSLRDILVFLPGERLIRDVERALGRSGPPGYEVLPLFARLPAAQQDRIFNPGPLPRIVLATNVAETSLTVPRIRFVIDSGLARVSRYSVRHRIQTLAVEPIAQANATQRAGRCGRLAPGTCVRLYSKDDLEARPEYTDPEMLRTNLAGVILRLEALGLGDIAAFPFLDAPPDKAVNDAWRLLEVLGAIDDRRRLTRDGRKMGRLPVDPRLARLLLTGERRRCLDDALTLASALAVGDPRELAPGKADAAREAQAGLTDARSDFMTYLEIWRAYRRVRSRGEAGVRRWCRQHCLARNRLREWDDVRAQLAALAATLGWKRGRREVDYATIHQVVVAAFVDFIAERDDDGTYRGMHGARAALFPGTPVAARKPRWIVAAEHVATERKYLRVIGRINPRWVLQAAPHLIRREHVDPRWDPRAGRVTVGERASVFGLVLSRDKRVDFGPIDPEQARAIFIRDALAADDIGEPFAFAEHNRGVKRRILDWEARTRSRDLYIGDRGLADFYSARLPPAVRDRRALREYCRDADASRSLELSVDDLATWDAGAEVDQSHPTTLQVGGQTLALTYRYEPGHDRDGITLSLPRLLVDVAQPEQFEWLVPGALGDKVLALLRTLPKELRRPLVPLPETVAAILPRLSRRFGREALVPAICESLLESREVAVAADAMRSDALPDHLRMAFEVLAETGERLAFSRDFAALRRRFGGSPGRSRPAPDSGWERSGLRDWDCGDLPETVRLRQYGADLDLYPALIDADGSVELTLLPPGPAAVERHRIGVRRLLLQCLRQQTSLLSDRIKSDRSLLLAFHGIGTVDELIDDVVCAAADEAFELVVPVRTEAAFRSRLAAGRADLVPRAERLLERLRELLPLCRDLRARLARAGNGAASAEDDLARQLGELVHPGFLTATPVEWRASLVRYLRGMRQRCEKGLRNPRDGKHQAQVERAWQRYAERRAQLPPGWPTPPALERYRWLVEELRISLFAQSLGTVAPVSSKRLEAYWRENV